eukprot:12385766-Alexandrium_andersonii.AAC.1
MGGAGGLKYMASSALVSSPFVMPDIVQRAKVEAEACARAPMPAARGGQKAAARALAKTPAASLREHPLFGKLSLTNGREQSYVQYASGKKR